MSKVNKITMKKSKSTTLLTDALHVPYDMLTEAQREAAAVFKKWYYGKHYFMKPILRIGGGAGVGKGYLLRYLLEMLGYDASECKVMAYTGQAVNVLRQYGILANTIHSTIMLPEDKPVIDKKTGLPVYRDGIMLTEVKFKPVKRLSHSVKLLVVDEASFLPKNIENTLLSYHVPILELGDPIQLPPVSDEQTFTMDKLDYFMEGVMRQSADSEIYDIATRFRRHELIRPELYHDEVLFLTAQSTIEETFHRFLPFFKHADVVLTSTNKQRQAITDLYRSEIIKTNSPYPVAGERMICRKNNWSKMLDQYVLANGMQGVCLDTVGKSEADKGSKTYTMNFQPDVLADTSLYFDNILCDTNYLTHEFVSTRTRQELKRPGEKFEYAHALTVHTCQGASYDTVLYLDSPFGLVGREIDYRARLRYTAITRARKRVIYIMAHSKYDNPASLLNIDTVIN